MKLRVFASLAEDINSGWVWVPETIVVERSVVRIVNRTSGKCVYCEALQIGQNYLNRYNTNDRTDPIINKDSSITINEWYRKKLGIEETQVEADFDITKMDNPWGHLRATLHNPQIVVRMAAELAILSIVLGVIGVWLGVTATK